MSLMPELPCPSEDKLPPVRVIADRISLKEERISVVDDSVVWGCVFVAGRADCAEVVGPTLFTIVRQFYD